MIDIPTQQLIKYLQRELKEETTVREVNDIMLKEGSIDEEGHHVVKHISLGKTKAYYRILIQIEYLTK